MWSAGEQSEQPEGQGRDVWHLPEQEPTNLVALWPDRQPPTATEILTALSSTGFGALQLEEELEHADPNVMWCVAAACPRLARPIVLWSEPAQPIPAEEAEMIGAVDCPWVVGAEVLLNGRDPLTDFINVMQLMAQALPDVPAILDVNTTKWHPRRVLDEVFAPDEVEPPADVLWTIHAVRSSVCATPRGPVVWLHTHGLTRCNLPELEMLEVPASYAEPAAELINDIASLLLEREAPAPGVPFEIGSDLRVMLRPWQELAPFMNDGAPGGEEDRLGERGAAHAGPNAVVCALEPEGAYRPTWVWPREVTQRLMRDEAGVYRTTRATERQAKIARRAWSELATAFASVAPLPPHEDGEPRALFGVKAGFAEDGDESSREHLWFQVCRFNGERVEGELVNHPLAVSRLQKGDRVWIEREQVSDWRVMTRETCFGPNDLASLWRAIDELKQQAGAP